MNKAKEELRQVLLKQRRQMSENDRLSKSKEITDKLKEAIAWSSISSVHIFESIDSLAEVETKSIIGYLKKNYPELKLYHPRKFMNSWQDMDENNNPAINLNYDVIIVPTLGFDSFLNRLGHGGGHYDKFLATQKSARTIGLCFELGHRAQIPVEPFDIPLDVVISEKQIYSARV